MTTDVTEESIEELEKKIEFLEMSRINLRVSPAVFDRLNKVATFHNQTIEDYCKGVLEESLNVLIGKAVISAPSNLSGEQVAKVTGPSSVSTVYRA